MGTDRSRGPFCHPSALRGLFSGFSPAQSPSVAPQCPEPQSCTLSQLLGHHLLGQLQLCSTMYSAQHPPAPHICTTALVPLPHFCLRQERPPFTMLFKSLPFLTAPSHFSPLRCPPGFSLVARELPKGCAPSLTHSSFTLSLPRLPELDSARAQKWPGLGAHPCPTGEVDS